MSNIFIPNKIKIGYQERTDTYTKKLAYVIYYGPDNKLRKKVSWDHWCNKKLGEHDYGNEPMEGFVLNKNVERCNWSYYGSGRSYIRVHDPRGFEFEVTPENLISILMETDCNHRALQGKFVYAWSGGDLILLPCGSEVYQEAFKNTSLVTSKFSAKALVVGRSYQTKKDEELVYMGRMPWTTWAGLYEYRKPNKVETSRNHVFWSPASQCFIGMNSASNLAHENSSESVPNYAELTDWLDLTPAKLGKMPLELDPLPSLYLNERTEHSWHVPQTTFFKEKDGVLYQITAGRHLIKDVKDVISSLRHFSRYHQEDPRYLAGKALQGKPGDYEAAITLKVDKSSPIDSLAPACIEQAQSPALLTHLGLEGVLFLPADGTAQQVKDAFFGDVVKPYLSVPGGQRKELSNLTMSDADKPWIELPKVQKD